MKHFKTIKHVAFFSILASGSILNTTIHAEGPCDIYAKGNTPCVAAYSTVRALYGSYSGNLYQVRRESDNTTKDIAPIHAGGIANAAEQDNFCSGYICRISIIYDQSGNGNDLTKAPGGSEIYGPNDDVEARADSLPVYINGYKAYGVHITPNPTWTSPGQVGYRNTNTNNIAKGDNPETIYMVTDGQYVNGACCFDFGNAEMGPWAGGYGTMESIYFGTNNWWTTGSGNGPWVMADLEVGVYSMGGAGNYSDKDKTGNKVNNQSQSLQYPFVTAYLKGNSSKPVTIGGPFVLKGGNAQEGELTTMWNGDYPIGYFPMDRQGGVVLGVGGDNSSGAQGNFYEGVLTAGFASEATDAEIQANIVAARYGQTTTIPSSSSTSSSSSSEVKEPFKKVSIPGTLQMEDYDRGGEGIAYHDADASNSGTFYRTDGVDIDSISAGGYAVGWLHTGEWMEYSLNSTVDATVNFFARVSSDFSGGSFHLDVDGKTVTPIIKVDSTGDWNNYQVISGHIENITKGDHVLKFVVDGSYFNIDWILFSDASLSLLGQGANASLTAGTYHVYDSNGKHSRTIDCKEGDTPGPILNNGTMKPGIYLIKKEQKGHLVQNTLVAIP